MQVVLFSGSSVILNYLAELLFFRHEIALVITSTSIADSVYPYLYKATRVYVYLCVFVHDLFENSISPPSFHYSHLFATNPSFFSSLTLLGVLVYVFFLSFFFSFSFFVPVFPSHLINSTFIDLLIRVIRIRLLNLDNLIN
ncbi:hypothetical protein HZH66_010001 [Vespula vulgaris]|uniref:Uncharacterized protein n=1 Tax=Vespula vulgaris TaxID=7454 RepID=A0A834MYX5_VESVU|nr:hypothetical protein HZH66_010001 [Vespula vulgaris]